MNRYDILQNMCFICVESDRLGFMRRFWMTKVNLPTFYHEKYYEFECCVAINHLYNVQIEYSIFAAFS